MSGFYSNQNQFALFGHEASDSDDSGYVENHPEAGPRDNVDHTTSGRFLSDQANQKVWGPVRRKEPAEATHGGMGYRLDRALDWCSQQSLGMIVRHVDLHYFPTKKAPRNQGEVVNLPKGGQVLEKNRLFLIVGHAVCRVTECPIFTYDEVGLEKRNKLTWHEYCSIRSSQVPVKDFNNQSPSNKVLDVAWVHQNEEVKESSMVRLSDVRSHDTNFDLPPAQVVRAISSEALKYAAKKVVDLMREVTTSARR